MPPVASIPATPAAQTPSQAARIPRVPSAPFAAALDVYQRAARQVRADAGAADGPLDIFVAERAPSPGAMAVAFGREGAIAIHPGEAAALQTLAARTAVAGAAQLSPDEHSDLQRRSFTALHEASHVTGPSTPEQSADTEADWMWEEGLASLNARRLLPAFMANSPGARPGAGTVAASPPPIGSITYSGFAQRIGELLRLTGAELDSAAFNTDIRQLAERMPWPERPEWVARHIVSHQLKRPATAADVAAVLPYVHRYVGRFEAGTGLIEHTVRDLPNKAGGA